MREPISAQTLEEMQAALPILKRRFEIDGDPLTVWMAIRVCNEAGVIRLPGWIRDYLGKSAQALAELLAAASPAGGRGKISEAELAGKALGFGAGKGRGTALSTKAKAVRDYQAYAASKEEGVRREDIGHRLGIGPDAVGKAVAKWSRIDREIQAAIHKDTVRKPMK